MMLLKRKKIDLSKKSGVAVSSKNQFDNNDGVCYNEESGEHSFDAICIGDIVKSGNKFGIVCHSEILTKYGQMASNPVQVVWADDGIFHHKQETLDTSSIVYRNPEGMSKIVKF